MLNNWVSPKYAPMIQSYEAMNGPIFPTGPIFPGNSPLTASAGGNCSNCGGSGRHIYVDPSDGQMKDLPCQACGGAGQSSL